MRPAALEEALARLDDHVRQHLSHARTPGMALALTDREGLIHASAYGVKDVSSGAPVELGTRFEIGSIGKTFTSVIVQQLREEGRLDLHAPVTEFLPWFDVRSRFGPITLHHLLTHTAGIIGGSDITSDSRFDVWALRDTEAGAAPGERFRYSNLGYRALGYVLENVLSEPYPDIVRRRVLEPLGMTSSEPAVTNEARPRLATPHDDAFDDRPFDPALPLVPATWLETDTGDGSLACTASDLASFLRMLLNGGRGPGGPVLSEESVALMTEPRYDTGSGWHYGYGVGTFRPGGRVVVGHGGSMVGFASTMWGDPEDGLGAVVLINGPDEGDFTEIVAGTALSLLRAARRDEALPEVPAPPDRFAVPDASQYEGTFRGDARTLVVRARGDGLILQTEGASVPLEPRGPDRFRAGHPGFDRFLLTFEREEGAISRLWHGGDGYRPDGSKARIIAETIAIAGPSDHQAGFVGHYRSYNPWLTNFRVVRRGTDLVWIEGRGWEEPLTEVGEATFRVGGDERDPERLRFGAVVDGRALRANLSGCDYYRITAP